MVLLYIKPPKNMKLIKKSLILFCLLGLVATTQNAKGQTAIGGGLAYGTEIESPGINLNGTYMVTENIAIAPSIIYFFPKSYYSDYKLKWLEVDLNGHYYFNTTGNIKPYALAGLNFSFLTVPTYDFSSLFGGSGEVENETTTKIGLNLGGGAEFDIDSSIKPFGQLSYSIIENFGQLVIIAGVRFPLN